MLRTSVLSVLLLALFSAVGVASDGDEKSATPLADAVAAVAASPSGLSPLPSWAVDHPERRPAALPVLYGTYAVVQAMDIYTTRKALAAGASESNPLMKPGIGAQIAIKAAAGAGTIYFAERAWKKNKVGAVVLMAVLNGATAVIAARNARHARR